MTNAAGKASPLKIEGTSTRTQELYERACAVRENAYSPYSMHKVGAALLTLDGKIYDGCNIENSSYGGTVCAERTAVFKAVSEKGKIEIVEIVVVTDANPPWPPCGFCRQVVAEFATPQTRVHSINLAGVANSVDFGVLMPMAFTSEHLKK